MAGVVELVGVVMVVGPVGCIAEVAGGRGRGHPSVVSGDAAVSKTIKMELFFY